MQVNPGFQDRRIRIGSLKDGIVREFVPWAESNTICGHRCRRWGQSLCQGFTNTLNLRRFVKK